MGEHPFKRANRRLLRVVAVAIMISEPSSEPE
jgi:hypothetical protein